MAHGPEGTRLLIQNFKTGLLLSLFLLLLLLLSSASVATCTSLLLPASQKTVNLSPIQHSNGPVDLDPVVPYTPTYYISLCIN